MQNVGRCLRGEKNGGTRHRRLVTAIDNLARFADGHPNHLFAKYFSPAQPGLKPCTPCRGLIQLVADDD